MTESSKHLGDHLINKHIKDGSGFAMECGS
jgi:hypothetical protein